MRARYARVIRAGIMSGRRFMAAARANPGWASGNLTGIHGEAHIRTVLGAPRDRVVRVENADPLLGRLNLRLLLPASGDLAPGSRIEHEGRSGVVTYVNSLGRDSDLVALVEWDEPILVPREDEALARAWDEGWSAHFLEWERQRKDPTHPITRTNPYGGTR